MTHLRALWCAWTELICQSLYNLSHLTQSENEFSGTVLFCKFFRNRTILLRPKLMRFYFDSLYIEHVHLYEVIVPITRITKNWVVNFICTQSTSMNRLNSGITFFGITFSVSDFITGGCYLVGKWLWRRHPMWSEPLFSRDFELFKIRESAL